MEIINIEARTFEAMMERFEAFAQKVNAICKQNGCKKMEDWLDGQDVCQILNISKRKLQSLRDNRQIAFTMIGHKVYYKANDVQDVIRQITTGKEVRDEQ